MKENKKRLSGFIAQLVEHSTGIAEVMGSNPPLQRKTLDSNDQNQGC